MTCSCPSSTSTTSSSGSAVDGTSTTSNESSTGFNNTAIYIAAAVVGALLLFLAIAVLIVFGRRRNYRTNQELDTEKDTMLMIDFDNQDWCKVTDIEIKELLGSGSFGSVYRGVQSIGCFLFIFNVSRYGKELLMLLSRNSTLSNNSKISRRKPKCCSKFILLACTFDQN
jgi:hypothetical protein